MISNENNKIEKLLNIASRFSNSSNSDLQSLGRYIEDEIRTLDEYEESDEKIRFLDEIRYRVTKKYKEITGDGL